MEKIKKIIQASIEVKQNILNDDRLLLAVNDAINIIVNAFEKGNKVLFCGNGGSASDAQHLAAEFSGRFYTDRDALPAEALHCNTSYITAVANDYSYDVIYSRLIKGIGNTGDVLVGLSTSGNRRNTMRQLHSFAILLIAVFLVGFTGGKLKKLSDVLINVPSEDTPRIQESHITLGHIICQFVEEIYFRDTND